MAWRDDLTQTSVLINGQSVQLVGGSFRGVAFRTVNAELKVGRRNQVNEYPQRDTPYVDDLGRRARRIVVEAYVIGPNYLFERNELIEAFEAAGPGELLHPRYGALRVSLDGEVSIKETPEQGGMARISATFVEDGLNTFPTARENTVAGVEAASNVLDEATQDDFANTFSVEGASVLADQALDGLKGLKNTVKEALNFARSVTSLEGLATIVRQVGGLTRDLAALIRTPVALVQGLRSVYAELVQELKRPLAAFADLQDMFLANPRPAPAANIPGSTRARSLTNDVARSDLQRRLALSNQARVLAVAIANTSVLPTANQAVDLRRALVAQIDTELEVNDPPLDVATALTNLRAAVVRDVAARAEFLKQRSSYTPQTVLPALVLAHQIYGDATRADELVDRNAVPHPAFMPARALEVLL